jgi:hypothetical protein
MSFNQKRVSTRPQQFKTRDVASRLRGQKQRAMLFRFWADADATSSMFSSPQGGRASFSSLNQ